MKKVVTFGLAAGFCYWRFIVTPRLNLPTEVGTLEALVHVFMGWVLAVFFCTHKSIKIRSQGPTPMIPQPPFGLDSRLAFKVWGWLWMRQWFYFGAFLIPTLFEVFMVVYQMKNK